MLHATAHERRRHARGKIDHARHEQEREEPQDEQGVTVPRVPDSCPVVLQLPVRTPLRVGRDVPSSPPGSSHNAPIAENDIVRTPTSALRCRFAA
jgi:hypothetical protein